MHTNLPFLLLIDITLPLHLQMSMPAVVLIVKSSPVKENAFSFICSIVSCGTQNLALGPSGGLKDARGAMSICALSDSRDDSESCELYG